VFRGLAPDARHITLEVQDVTLMEPSEDLALAVGHDGPFTLGGRAAHATVTRALDRRSGGSVIEVAVTPGCSTRGMSSSTTDASAIPCRWPSEVPSRSPAPIRQALRPL